MMAPTVFERQVMLGNKRGLHARAASKFVRMAKKFAADVTVEKDSMTVNGRSIMGLMMLAARCGDSIRVSCQGPEAELAMVSLTELVREKFGED